MQTRARGHPMLNSNCRCHSRRFRVSRACEARPTTPTPRLPEPHARLSKILVLYCSTLIDARVPARLARAPPRPYGALLPGAVTYPISVNKKCFLLTALRKTNDRPGLNRAFIRTTLARARREKGVEKVSSMGTRALRRGGMKWDFSGEERDGFLGNRTVQASKERVARKRALNAR